MAFFDVLVTGSSGHLGHALMLLLPTYGFKPLGLDILPSPTTHHTGSISDMSLVTSIFKTHPIKHVIHTATLHKPHVCSHTEQDFIDTNITGTLVLLQAAATNIGSKLESFIFFSTTSTFGAALSPAPGKPAVWIDETVVPKPKNIYGVTKVAAEDICFLAHKQLGIPVLVLRSSRFFPEEDDDDERRMAMNEENLKILEMAYRRCDLEDIVSATICAMAKARDIRWGRYIISAPPPFENDPDTLAMLDQNPAEVFGRVVPGIDAVLQTKGWKHLKRIDRVYDSSKAIEELGWKPKYTIHNTVACLAKGEEWRSKVTAAVGRKGYHAVTTGIYTKR
ncbi:putative oxidoreductase [Stachybotrys elegans]|uniref:Oxidoreductase n=1 Tax=Stachybotrys elegans TaxID=80388 RepID=A0A8K0SU00_9HYPO|nr:putative oxidoreductase [Stachybotrys elegans]